jgi:tetratricopeptide (TPR) repeat protein
LVACGSKAVKDAQSFVDVKEFGRAKDLLDLELKTNPKNEAAYLLLGKVDLLLDQDADAQKAFDTALLLDKSNSTRIGALYREAGEQRYDDALNATPDQHTGPDITRVTANFAKAVTYDPDEQKTIRDWALAEAKRRATSRRTIQPLYLLDLLVTIDPDARTAAADTAMGIAKTYADRAFHDEAGDYAAKAATWDPKYLKPAAQLLRTAGIAQKNLEFLRLAIKWDPTLDNDDVAWVFVEQHARTPEEYLGTHHPAKHLAEARERIQAEQPPTQQPIAVTNPADTPIVFSY